MNARTRGVVIGVGGLMAGGFAASVVELPIWPKAGLVAAVCAIVSLVLWLSLRPRLNGDK